MGEVDIAATASSDAGPLLAPEAPADRFVVLRPDRPRRRPGGAPRSRRRYVAPAAALSVFAVSRLLAARAGVGFDASQLASYWQFVDPRLLKDHLLTTVFYLHVEPPLFNLFLGLVLRFSPFPATTSFHLAYLGLGVVLTLGLYDLARQFGASRVVAVVLTIVITCSPVTILYENWLFYEYPIAVGLVVMAVALVRWARSGSRLAFAGFAFTGAAIVLTRSLFHPVWFGVALVVALLARPRSIRRPAIAAMTVAAVLLIGAVVVKNAVLFDTPGLSSWVGMNLAETTVQQIAASDRAGLIKAGVLSPVSSQLPWEPYDTYRGLIGPCQPQHRDVGVLNSKARPSTAMNFNYECYLPLFRQFQRDSLAAAVHRPGDVARGQVDSWQLSFEPSSTLKDLDANRGHLQTFDHLYGRALYLEVTVPRAVTSANPRGNGLGARVPLSVTVVLAFLTILGLGVHRARRWIGRRPPPSAVAEVFIAFTMAWTFVIGNAVEFGQNERFRYVVEPLMLLVLGLSLDRAIRWAWRRRPRPRRTPRPADTPAVADR